MIHEINFSYKKYWVILQSSHKRWSSYIVFSTDHYIYSLQAVKKATTAVTKSASTILVIFIACTLALFFKISWDTGRVIQMNMEIGLIGAHLCLIVPDMSAVKSRRLWSCRM